MNVVAATASRDTVARPPLRVRRTWHPWRWAAAIAMLGGFVWLVSVAASLRTFDYGAVADYLFDPTILSGVKNTILLTVIAQSVGIVLGVLAAVARISPNPVVSSLSWLYIWFFRGTPVLVQIIFWFNVGVLFPVITLGLPLFGEVGSWPTNTVITAFTAAILGLGINEGAYMAEIVRGGMLSVERGQIDAAKALGMTSRQATRRIVLPQALRVIIPPTGNELINMLKMTSLVTVISYSELLTSAQNIYSRNLLTLELLVVASIWYLAITSVLTVGQCYLERRLAHGQVSSPRGGTVGSFGRTLRSALGIGR